MGRNLETFIKDNIEICETFSTTRKLLRYLGYPDTSSKHTRTSQLKDAKRYIDFDKTNNIFKDVNAPKSEIMITEKYETPLLKSDNRISEQNQLLIEELKKLIFNIDKDRISYSKIIEDYILQTKLSQNTTTRIAYYNSYLINFIKGKINVALRYLSIEYKNDFTWEYTYIARFNNNDYFTILSEEDINYIDIIKESIKLKLVARHNDNIIQQNKEKGMFTESHQTWKDIGFKYRNILYREIEDDLKNQKNIDDLYKVLIINNRVENSYLKSKERNDINYELLLSIIKNKMEEYINNKKNTYIDDVVLEHHNKLFN